MPLWQKQILFSFPRFCPGNPRSQTLQKIISQSFSANFFGKDQIVRFLQFQIIFRYGKIRSYFFPSDSIPKTADLIPKPPDFKLSGNLDLGLLSQISVGKLRSYFSWKFRYYSVMTKINFILFPQIFSRKPQISNSLENYILVLFRKFLRERLDCTLSGTLDNIPLQQKNIYFSFPADLITKTANLIPKPPDFRLCGNLDLGLFPQISVGKLRTYAFWKFRFYSSTANFPRETRDPKPSGKLDFGLSQNFAGKLRSYFPWKSRISSVMAKADLILLSADFVQVTPDIMFSGNLHLGLFSQISAGKLRPYFSWKDNYHSVMAKTYLILFPQILSRKPQIIGSLEIQILVCFCKFLRESLDLSFPENFDITPLWQKQILLSFHRSSP